MPWRRWLSSAGLERRGPPPEPARSYQPIRRERLIAGCRVALSLLSLFAVWLDPSEPAHAAPVAYALIAAYAVYSVALALWV